MNSATLDARPHRETTAWHEAGHVLAATTWTGNVHAATIKPDDFTHGRTTLRRVSPEFFRGLPRVHRIQHFVGWVRVNVAGLAAEEVYTGKRPLAVFAALCVQPREWRENRRWYAALTEEEQEALEWYDGDDSDLEGALEAMAMAYPSDTASATRKRVAAEYDFMLEFLAAHRASLESLADALLAHETLDRDGVDEALGDDGSFYDWIMRGLPRVTRRSARASSAVVQGSAQ